MLEIRKEITNLGTIKGNFKPHKLLALLAAIKVLEKKNFADCKVFFDEQFKIYFTKSFYDYSFDKDHSCRPHTPFFHLKTASFWTLIPVYGKESELDSLGSIGGPGFLKDTVQFAEVTEYFLNLLKDKATRKEITDLIQEFLLSQSSQIKSEMKRDTSSCTSSDNMSFNSFVSYLNSLQRLGGGNENALAESQACNEAFASIHVPHPLADAIEHELRSPNGRHIILTGHAGDGKSTIALEVFKRLSGIPSEQALSSPLLDREDIDREDIGAVSIIKDFSERDKHTDSTLMEKLREGKRRFLIVSNTGTLLDFVKKRAEQLQENPVTLESNVLSAISSEDGEGILRLSTQEFRVFNLSKIDNLRLARQIFEKMLAPVRWLACDNCNCHSNCPIRMNVRLLKQQPLAVERIFLAYRKMYEYGIRLTMRQFTEHLAYIITAGLTEEELYEIAQDDPDYIYPQYLFFNTFFGDDGVTAIPHALEMKAVQEIRMQGFGARPCPSWEHKLWLLSGEASMSPDVEQLERLFNTMLSEGGKKAGDENTDSRASREQVRRMLYFLKTFEPEDKNYISQYLNSPTLLNWQSWQNTGAQLEFSEKNSIEQKILHVLQEHFSGVRIPEGAPSGDRRLYITLSRKRGEVRQSAQVVLAQLDWDSSVELRLVPSRDACGAQRQDLMLCGKGPIQGLDLALNVPFLDFVMMRHLGELGEVLQASYIERLDRFKADVHDRTRQNDKDEIMLVRLKKDHTFRRQHFAVKKDRLEVTNAT